MTHPGREEETGPYELAALLEMFRGDLHPAYANTSRRGRGIGGQAITAQCNYLDPEGAEYRIIERIDDAIREWFRRAERDGVDMQDVRRRILEVRDRDQLSSLDEVTLGGGLSIRHVALFCDRKCGAEIEADIRADTAEQAYEGLRRIAVAEQGWQVTEHEDICPNCASS